MKRALTLAGALALAALIAGTAGAQIGQGPRGPMGPEQMTAQMQKMMERVGAGVLR